MVVLREASIALAFYAAFFCWNGMPQRALAQTRLDVYRSPEITIGNLKVGDRRIAVQSETALGSRDAFSVSYISIDPAKSRISLVAARDLHSGGSSLARFALDEHASAVLNGGFLESQTPATPSGLLQIANKTVNAYQEDLVMDGVLCFSRELKSRSVAMVPVARREQIRADFPDCVQAGPLLILDGEQFSRLEKLDEDPLLKKFSALLAERSFVAWTKSGRVVLGVTTPASLYSLRTALLAAENEGGFEAVQATALTGRSTAGLIAGDAKGFARGNIETLLPNAIIVRE
jgi:hypothetical protein